MERSIVSWANEIQNPVSVNQLTNVVPGALRAYDLPELAGSIAPRTLRIVNPVDGQLRPVSQAEMDAVYAGSRAFFSQKGAEHRLILRAEK